MHIEKFCINRMHRYGIAMIPDYRANLADWPYRRVPHYLIIIIVMILSKFPNSYFYSLSVLIFNKTKKAFVLVRQFRPGTYIPSPLVLFPDHTHTLHMHTYTHAHAHHTHTHTH